jgi:hypothetical protein
MNQVKDICEELKSLKHIPFGDELKDLISLASNLTLNGKHKFTRQMKLAKNNAKEVKGNITKDQTSSDSSLSSNFGICILCHYPVIHIIRIDNIRTLWRCILWSNINKRLWPGLRVATYGAGVAKTHTCVVHLA